MNKKQRARVKKRVKEIIGGIAFTIIFAVFAFISCKVAVHSSDTEFSQNYLIYGANMDYGYDRVRYLTNHGRLEEADIAQQTFDDWMWRVYTEGFIPEEDYQEWSLTVDIDAYKSQQSAADSAAASPQSVSYASGAADTSSVSYSAPSAAAETEAVSVYVDPDSPAGRAAAKGLPAPPDIDITERQYILVNSENTVDQNFEPTRLAYLNMTGGDTDIRYDYDANRQVVDDIMAQALVDFAQGCKNAGLPVYLSSGYRSYSEQQYLFNRKLNQGYSYDVAKTIVAYPGTSEHQTGLCCDITDYYHELKDSSLENTDTFKWLNEHCAEYGFILRYPADKSGGADTITGCIYEPWHFRYVGVEAATYMKNNNLCLEEFWELYE